MLKIINGTKKEKPNYVSAYARTLLKEINNSNENQNQYDIEKIIFCGVKMIASDYDLTNKDEEQLINRFDYISVIKELIGRLTPRELLNIFPVNKTYNGAKYQSKDYFSTMEALNSHGIDKIIGENASEILWDYMNNDICDFEVHCMSVMSAIMRAQGKKDLFDSFLESQGKPPLTKYYLETDAKGREYLKNGTTGEVKRVYKKIPRYLKVAK